jgi:hypothetical protein
LTISLFSCGGNSSNSLTILSNGLVHAEGTDCFFGHRVVGFFKGGPLRRLLAPVVRLIVVMRLRGYDATSQIGPVSGRR